MDSNILRLGGIKSPTVIFIKEIRGTRGYATVELAMTLPILALAMCLGLWLSNLALLQIQLQSSATSAARILARGEELPADFSSCLPAGTVLESTVAGRSVTVMLSLAKRTPLSAVPISTQLKARSVAKLEDQQSAFINQE